MAKVLLVEDDQDIQYTVANYLKHENYTVELARNGREAIELLSAFQYDVIILDIELPLVSGYEVVRDFRKSGGSTPVIMLTGKTEITDKEHGLDSGADDYLTKPFDMRELMARLRALLRRPSGVVASNILISGDLELNTATRKLKRNGEEVYLLPRDFELLEFFMRHRGDIFSTEALLERVWHNDRDVSPDALRSALRRLRKKIGDTECSIIENIPKVGYRLRPD